MNKKDTFEDDGRVIADMSGIERPPMLIPRFKKRSSEDAKPAEPMGRDDTKPAEPMGRDDRKAFIKGAVAAGLLVAGVFALAFAAVIWLIGNI